MNETTQSEAALIAELNDLLQLDHDAVQAYTLAISSLKGVSYQNTLRRFRGDHERHIEELTPLIRAHGGLPIELPHLPTGAFKLAVQAAGAAGGDRAVLLAFKANERQVRDKYRRAVDRLSTTDAAAVVSRNAADELVHYGWALETLEDLGYGADSAAGRAERAFEVAHKGVADAVEGVERRAMQTAEGARRALTERTASNPLAMALLAVAAGFLAGQLKGRGTLNRMKVTPQNVST